MTPLLLSFLAPAAMAGQQLLTYDLMLGSQRVGTRTLKVRHLPEEPGISGASRLIESWTDLKATVAGQEVRFQGRASIRATETRLSFTSVWEQNGTRMQVQGTEGRDGSWTITRQERGSTRELTYRGTEVDLSTFHLLDPSLRQRALEEPSLDMLIAETGDVVTGPSQSLGRGSLQIGGEPVTVDRWTWDPDGGLMEAAWTEDGLLVQYTVAFLGQRLTATAREIPASTWGSVDVQSFEQSGGGVVTEEEL